MTQDDPTLPLAGHRRNDNVDPFEYGDRTLYFLRNQEFDVAEEYGTMIAKAGQSDETLPLAAAESELVTGPDAERALEQKIDAMLTRMSSIESRLASIDAALARVLAR